LCQAGIRNRRRSSAAAHKISATLAHCSDAARPARRACARAAATAGRRRRGVALSVERREEEGVHNMRCSHGHGCSIAAVADLLFDGQWVLGVKRLSCDLRTTRCSRRWLPLREAPRASLYTVGSQCGLHRARTSLEGRAAGVSRRQVTTVSGQTEIAFSCYVHALPSIWLIFLWCRLHHPLPYMFFQDTPARQHTFLLL